MGENKKIDESAKQESMFTIISQWISELVETETLPEEIVALNFGLYETPKGYCIYLNGSEEYDEEDEDWACNNDCGSKQHNCCTANGTHRSKHG